MKGLQLSWRVDPTLPQIIMSDASRLQQILLNLLSNGQRGTTHHWDCLSPLTDQPQEWMS